MDDYADDPHGGGEGGGYSDVSSTGSGGSVEEGDNVGREEVEKMSAQKTTQVFQAADEPTWRQSIREQMETELERRVRDALATPPRERLNRRRQQAQQRSMPRDNDIDDINAHLLLGLSEKEQNSLRSQRWRALQAHKDAIMTYFPSNHNAQPQVEFIFRDQLSKSNQDEFPGVFGLESFSEGIKNIREDYTNVINRYGSKPKTRHFYTKEGFLKSLRAGTLPPGVQFLDDTGRYVDKYGVIRNNDGPFWPVESVPLFPTPRFKWWNNVEAELLYIHLQESSRTIDNQTTPFNNGRWRGTLIVYDSERSPREYNPQPVSEGCCPNLVFESRFESGNLRQARRIGMYEYELVLKTDLYTSRHTQWYFFRIHNAQPGVTYKFKIVNLLKSDSLYNYGMRPLAYSERDAAEKQTGWIRTGHHINYTKNITNTTSPLLSRCFPYYMLEWQMEFPNADDTYYLAHCYPYTFTDLKEDLDVLMASPGRKACIRREVLCESRAGNSCFLLTVTNFESEEPKKAVVVSARVHPGESQASWMMKGLLEYITGDHPVAKELRDKFVFKMVPMLNPDGVIVGNYRCSLAARDLNRNYRRPRRENFPTIFAVKAMIEELSQDHEIMLYCDLHGHSRKHNVFMYGNNTSSEEDTSGTGAARAFISERLFPWLMASTCPDKFAFRSCKFQIRRCKESTGRVVMWRQMNIYNSFTLEATFSGTIINKDQCRHFNVRDLMDIGRGLAQTVLEYYHVQENKTKQTETVLQLTKAITHQILESRGLIIPGSVLPDFLVDKNLMETDAQAVQDDAEKWTSAMLTLLQNPPAPDPNAAANGREDKVSRKQAAPPSAGLSKVEASELMDRASLSTMDGCLNVLAAINVREALQESDSSDSDSESEPEMKLPDPKPRKKKRKSRKQRDKDHHDSKKQAGSDKRVEEKEPRGKTYSPQNGPKTARDKEPLALPALLCAEATPTNSLGHALSAGSTPLDTSSLLTAQLAKRKAGSTSVLERLNKEKKNQFQSKYEGRHNGGVPCFTEERSLERAAKRVAEMKKKYEDDRQRDVTLLCEDEQPLFQCPTQMYPNVLSQDDLNQRLQVALSEGTANLSRTLMGMNVRTGYTHADSLQELHPTINGNYMLAAQLSSQQANYSAHGNGNAPFLGGGNPVAALNGNSSHATGNGSHAVGNGSYPGGNGSYGGGNGSYGGGNRHPLAENYNENRLEEFYHTGFLTERSSSEDSDSGSEVLKSQSAVPVSSRRSPYYLDLIQRSPSLSFWPVKNGSSGGGNHGNGSLSAILPSSSVAKRPVRYKTSQGQGQIPSRRHSSQASPPFMASSIHPISRDPPRHYDNHLSSLATTSGSQAAIDKPQYERPRIGRTPLIRGLRHPSIQQGYM